VQSAPRPRGGTPLSDFAPQSRKRLGDVLVESGLITADQLKAALAAQRGDEGPRRRLGQVVTDLGFATEREVAECLANLLGLEMVDLSKLVPAPDVVKLLPRAVAERTRVLVLDRAENGLVVAAADPTNVLALDDVRLYTRSVDLQVLVAADSQITEQLNRAWSLGQGGSDVTAFVEEGDSEEDSQEAVLGASTDEAPIVKLVNQILGDAVRLRASDIHIEVQRDGLRVRYRIDGLLRDVMRAPRRIASSVVSRIKIMSGLDIAERRVPQDGRTRIVVEGNAIDTRVSTLPSLHGEKVVIRLLTRGDAVPGLDDLGFDPNQLEIFREALATPQGLILITGPTGSGKTNTLYSAIAEVRSPEQNIVTLEDPIEVQLTGITQVGVNEKTGMTFNRGLRSILRQDPDIVLVGEVRDGETAELALKASMTGHMVLTTLHTNSAVAAITRLVDMGAEPFLVASSLTAAVAQRLVRRPCPGCAEPYEPDEVTLTLLGLHPRDLRGATPVMGTGCPECGGTGYRGRTAVYEVLAVDAELRQILIKDPSEVAIAEHARSAGMMTLRGAAIAKARRGETTFEEAIRVTHADRTESEVCPACERLVEPDMLACPWCAATLERYRCASCGRDLTAEWVICPWCRTPSGGVRDGGPGPGADVPGPVRQEAPRLSRREALAAEAAVGQGEAGDLPVPPGPPPGEGDGLFPGHGAGPSLGEDGGERPSRYAPGEVPAPGHGSGPRYEERARYRPEPGYGTEPGYEESPGYEDRPRYRAGPGDPAEAETGPGYGPGYEPEAGPRYGTGQEYETDPWYGTGQEHETDPRYGSGQEYETDPRYGSGQEYETDPRYGTGQEHETDPRYEGQQQYRADPRYEDRSGHGYGAAPDAPGPVAARSEGAGGPPVPGPAPSGRSASGFAALEQEEQEYTERERPGPGLSARGFTIPGIGTFPIPLPRSAGSGGCPTGRFDFFGDLEPSGDPGDDGPPDGPAGGAA